MFPFTAIQDINAVFHFEATNETICNISCNAKYIRTCK